jgi:hypothetical protein
MDRADPEYSDNAKFYAAHSRHETVVIEGFCYCLLLLGPTRLFEIRSGETALDDPAATLLVALR